MSEEGIGAAPRAPEPREIENWGFSCTEGDSLCGKV